MIWLVSVLSLFLMVLIVLFFLPFYFEVDSNTGLFCIRYSHLVKASLRMAESTVTLEIKTAVWKKSIDLLTARPKKKQKTTEKKAKPKWLHFTREKMIRLLQSFRVNKCRLKLDTGIMQWNALLFPCFVLLSRRSGKSFTINFQNEQEVVFEIENNLARIIRAYFNF